MERCEHYTLDCQAEKRTCEGCAYNTNYINKRLNEKLNKFKEYKGEEK
jgi:hypothetical protein